MQWWGSQQQDLAQQQFRKPAQPQPARQPQQQQFNPLPEAAPSAKDAEGNVQIAAEEYVHDTSGDNTLSTFQLFQLKKKQEAEGN